MIYSRRRKLPGAGRTAADKKYASEIGEDHFPSFFYEPKFQAQFIRMGFRPNLPEWIVRNALDTRRRSVRELVNSYRGKEYRELNPEAYSSDEKMGQAHLLVAKHIYSYKDWDRLATLLLAAAVEFGNVEAAIALCNIENMRPHLVAPAKAKQIVQDTAERSGDWQAMVVHAKSLSGPKVGRAAKDRAYELVKQAASMVKPTDPDPRGSGFPITKPPWSLLRDFAQERLENDGGAEAREAFEAAVTVGALQYDDPMACGQLASLSSTKIYSQLWIRLITKAAMAGDDEAALQLAKYHLEREGWYPTRDRSNLAFNGSVGLDWLEFSAAAAFTDPETMAVRYLTLALVLRESGYAEEGLRHLKSGRESLESSLGDEVETGKMLQKMQGYIDDWEGELPLHVRASMVLKAPLMSPAKIG